MRELFQILIGFAGAAVSIWLLLKAQMFCEEHFGFGPLRRKKMPKVEIQTLFHGNTKDQDQI